MHLQPVIGSLIHASVAPIHQFLAVGNRDRFDQNFDGTRIRGRVKTESSFLQNQRQLGAGLISVGIVLTLLSMILLFQPTLLKLGNLSLICGFALFIGPKALATYFMKESRLQATIIIAIGILLVLYGHPRIGLLIEIFGLFNLFGNMFPVVWSVVKNLPGISDLVGVLFPSQNGRQRFRDSELPLYRERFNGYPSF